MITDEMLAAAIAVALPVESAAGRVGWTRRRDANPYYRAGYVEIGDVTINGHVAGWWWDNRECPLSPSLRPFPAVAVSAFYTGVGR